MKRRRRTANRRVVPLWVHFITVATMGSLFLGFLILRSGGIEARAQSFLDTIGRGASPVLNAEAMLGHRRTERAQGSYVLNGMHVKYFTLGAPEGGGKTIIELEKMMARAGYVHRIVRIQGVPTLVGIHPRTKVMLTAKPGRDLQGAPAIRFSQQNLSELRRDFDAEIPGLPTYPGASGKMLISSSDGGKSESLMYTAGGTKEDIRSYYLREMRSSGWSPMAAPAPPPGLPSSVTFFSRGGKEASVLVVDVPSTAVSLVLVTVGAGQGVAG